MDMKTLSQVRNYLLLLLGCTLMITSGCSKDEEDEKENTISDENFYKMVGASLINCYVDIYNQNLAGVVTGSHNITTDGPMGGIVVITGTTTYDNTHGITTTDLVFSMNGVKYTYSQADGSGKSWVTQVTLTGYTTYTGSFSNNYTSVNHQSANLQIAGTVSYNGITRSINSMGAVSINRSSTVAVNIFGHTVSW
jgi:hypothetical protein